MVTTLEWLRCMSGRSLWEISQELQKDPYETLALLRGERQQSLTSTDVALLAQLLGAPFEQVVAAANASYAINCHHRFTLPAEETIEARWQREEAAQHFQSHGSAAGSSGGSDPLQQAFALLGLPMNASSAQIGRAFRRCVKAASDGKGGYHEDMGRLVQAKELALAFCQRAS